MATHSSIPAWKIPWTEELGRLQYMGLQQVEREWATKQQQSFTILAGIDAPSFNELFQWKSKWLFSSSFYI